MELLAYSLLVYCQENQGLLGVAGKARHQNNSLQFWAEALDNARQAWWGLRTAMAAKVY